MGAEENMKTVQGVYKAFEGGDVQATLDVLAADVDFASEPDEDIAPWHGQRSKADAPAFFQALGETVDATELTPLAFASNDTDVMAVINSA